MSKAQMMILAAWAMPLNQMVPEQGAVMLMPGDQIAEVLKQECGLWLGPRGQLENNTQFRQVLPYIVLKVGGQILRYKRGRAGEEGRLHDLYSIGFGGHVELDECFIRNNQVKLMSTLDANSIREVEEELPGTEPFSKDWAGLIIDNSNEVGRVHVGVLGVWQLASAEGLESGEDDQIQEVELMDLADLYAQRDQLESWSRMIVEQWHAPSWPPV
jgi:predicted NUDIX family phosphoesterase